MMTSHDIRSRRPQTAEVGHPRTTNTKIVLKEISSSALGQRFTFVVRSRVDSLICPLLEPAVILQINEKDIKRDRVQPIQLEEEAARLLTRRGVDPEGGVPGDETVADDGVVFQVSVDGGHLSDECTRWRVFLYGKLIEIPGKLGVVIIGIEHIDNNVGYGGVGRSAVVGGGDDYRVQAADLPVEGRLEVDRTRVRKYSENPVDSIREVTRFDPVCQSRVIPGVVIDGGYLKNLAKKRDVEPRSSAAPLSD